MHHIDFTEGLCQRLAAKGIVLDSFRGIRHVGDALSFEPPLSSAAELVPDYPLSIGAFTHVNGGFIRNVSIGRYCSIARDVQIGHGYHPSDWLSVSSLQYVPNYRNWPAFVEPSKPGGGIAVQPFEYGKTARVGNDVWLGNHVIIMDGITIGDGAIVGAGSIVTKDIPPYAIVVGNPARILRMRFDERTVERLLAIRFWRFTMNDLGDVYFPDVPRALDQIEQKISDGRLQEYKPEIISTETILRLSQS